VSVVVENGGVNTDDVVRALRAALQKPVVNATTVTPVAKDVSGVFTAAPAKPKSHGSKRHMLAFLLATALGMTGIWFANKAYAPEMYGDSGMVAAADAHAKGLNYSVFDLNLNIRALREEQLKRMTKTPEVIILGASHWQEAHKDLLRGQDFFNAHIHRDYWEDPLGMVELLVRYNRLPKKLIISIRDNQFKPVEKRTDFLWEPGIPAYRVMSDKLGLQTESYVKTLPYDRMRAKLSLPMLFENFTRWQNANEHPGPSEKAHFETLDTLLPDGSILWSNHKMQLFTQERTLAESLAFVEKKKNDPPIIEPQGLLAFNTLLTFLKDKGVSVYLVNPPFNPMFYDRVQGTPYGDGLVKFEALVKKIATEHNLPLFGSFNPHTLGCTAEMYIDAEHSNPQCLQKIFDQFIAIEKAEAAK
jgi:hypothetical protein